MQHQIEVQVQTPLNLPTHYGSDQLSSEVIAGLMAWHRPACTVVSDLTEHHWGLVLIWLPGVPERTLDLLALEIPQEMNIQSADLMTSRTVLSWDSGDGTEVCLDMWLVNAPFLYPETSKGFLVAFINETTARCCTHILDYDALDSMIGGLQGAMASSGPNYTPFRIWSDEVLDAHAGLLDEPESGVIYPDMLHPS